MAKHLITWNLKLETYFRSKLVTEYDPHSTGIQGEESACRYLVKEGYHVLDRNYRAERYEIDIIARTGDTIVFCEVKTARSKKFGPSISWVTPDKIRHIALAASEYINSHELNGCSFRFDVIGIDVVNGEIIINHIENAFTTPEDV